MAKKVYVAIDLKSFYASAECVARGLDPLHTNLVVADAAPDGEDHLPGCVPVPERATASPAGLGCLRWCRGWPR